MATKRRKEKASEKPPAKRGTKRTPAKAPPSTSIKPLTKRVKRIIKVDEAEKAFLARDSTRNLRRAPLTATAAARPTSVTVLGHQFPSPLTTTRPLSLPLTPLTHLTVTNPSAATPSSLPAARSLSVRPARSPIILLSHHHRPSSPQFLILPAKPPRQPSSPPPFTAVPVSVSAAPALS
nr:lysine-rich arabinogalactan protein 19-like [Arachis hypogaea]